MNIIVKYLLIPKKAEGWVNILCIMQYCRLPTKMYQLVKQFIMLYRITV